MSVSKCQATLTLGLNATFVLHALLLDFSGGLVKKQPSPQAQDAPRQTAALRVESGP